MTALRALIEAIEAGEMPVREAEAAIHVAAFKPGWHTMSTDPGAVAETPKHFWPTGKLRFISSSAFYAPHYLTSLDAAATLMPEGWRITVLQQISGTWRAHAFPPKPPYNNIDVFNAPTEPRARSLAALKALEASAK